MPLKCRCGSLLVLLVCAIGCHNEKPCEPNRLVATVLLDETAYGLSYNATLLGDSIILIDSKSDCQIKIFDAVSQTLRVEFGTTGQGPEEFVAAYEILPHGNDKDSFFIFDFQTRILKGYSVENVVSGDFYPTNSIYVDAGSGIINQLEFLPNGDILGIGIFPSGRLILFDDQGHMKNKIGQIPEHEGEDMAMQHSHGYMGKFAIKHATREVFVALLYGSSIEKYNLDTGYVTTFFLHEDFSPEYDIVPVGEYRTMAPNEKTRFGFFDICYDERADRIFLLYSGEYHGKRPTGTANTVCIMDMTGHLLSRMELELAIGAMEISDDGSKIFGMTDRGFAAFETHL